MHPNNNSMVLIRFSFFNAHTKVKKKGLAPASLWLSCFLLSAWAFLSSCKRSLNLHSLISLLNLASHFFPTNHTFSFLFLLMMPLLLCC